MVNSTHRRTLVKTSPSKYPLTLLSGIIINDHPPIKNLPPDALLTKLFKVQLSKKRRKMSQLTDPNVCGSLSGKITSLLLRDPHTKSDYSTAFFPVLQYVGHQETRVMMTYLLQIPDAIKVSSVVYGTSHMTQDAVSPLMALLLDDIQVLLSL